MSISVANDHDIHPIDMAESLAEKNGWDFDRVTDDQIAMAVAGQWRTYSLTIAWNQGDETLRFICTFEIEPPASRLPHVYELLNKCNDMLWAGAFTLWPEQKLMVWRYGLLLSGGQVASSQQIDRMVANGVVASERFYPAFQLVTFSEYCPADALKAAIAEAYGRA